VAGRRHDARAGECAVAWQGHKPVGRTAKDQDARSTVKGVPWEWEEIEREWLAGSAVSASPAEVVDAFDRVEAMFGRDWITASREQAGGVSQGSLPTLNIVTLGQLMAAVDGVRGSESLLEKIRRSDETAWVELSAIHLLRSPNSSVAVELEPVVLISGRERKPDFRVQKADSDWTYVEVTAPGRSVAQQAVLHTLERIGRLIDIVKKGYALEVLLRREPTETEEEYLVERVPEVCRIDGVHTEELPDRLGMLILNATGPGQVVLMNHEGEEDVPRLGRADARAGPDEPHRHIVVRLAFTDERADEFLRVEARQLPTDAPGLIMIQTSRAVGSWRRWVDLLRQRLTPDKHTRVSGICLLQSGYVDTPQGESWRPEAKLILNTHARFELPRWISETLATFAPQQQETQTR
jgi:hypothetical protein